MYMLDGAKIDISSPYTSPDGVRYPHLRDAAIRFRIGVVEVPDPVRPSDLWYTVNERHDGTYSAVPKPLAALRSMVEMHIEAARDQARFANVSAHGRAWQADPASQQLLTSAILLAQAGVYTPTEWRDADNGTMVVTDLAQLLAIAGAIAEQTRAAYTQSWQRKADLAACTTVEDVIELYDGLAA